MSKKYQIGIIGATMNGDFGLTASYLGLYEYITNYMKLSATIIPPGKNKKWQESTVSFFNEMCDCQKKVSLTRYHKYQSIIDTFVLGPGGLWEYTKFDMKASDFLSYLNFLNDETKRISYSTSFIEDYPTVLIGHPEKMGEYTDLLNKFSGLGVACETDKECLSEYHEINDSICVIDTIFLPKIMYWVNMVKNKNYNEEENIILYPLNKISRIETVNNVSEFTGIPNIKIATGHLFECQTLVDKSIVLDDLDYVNPPEKPMGFKTWLENIFNCKYLICADYYSLCFAIIFKKNFVIFEEPEDKRVEYLVKKLGVEGRLVKNYEDKKIVELFNTPIDYQSVYKRLISYRKESTIWLNKRLKNEVN